MRHTVSIKPYPVIDIRRRFPILSRTVRGKTLVYLDNAATTQKPQEVIEALVAYYTHSNSNVHRGVHFLSQEATDGFEAARKKAADFLDISDPATVIFTRGTTESVNIVAHGLATDTLKPGMTVLVSALEHHSNLVPWQMACERSGATLKIIPMDDRGVLDLEAYEVLLKNNHVALVAVNHISNALGTINPVEKMTRLAHAHGALILVDGAQGAPHLELHLEQLDVDFYTVSGHKVYGPTGIGLLYGKRQLLEALTPYQGGGEMIETVTYEKSTYAGLPHRFEAGTPHIAGAIGLGAALDFMLEIGRNEIAQWENQLLQQATVGLSEIPGIRFFGTAPEKAGVVSFLVGDIHPYDLGTLLDQMGVAVRTGHHCAQPIMDAFNIPGTVRASFACYNTQAEVQAFLEAVRRAITMLS
jgi:cysteine desulfurase / selenocysteine lyase